MIMLRDLLCCVAIAALVSPVGIARSHAGESGQRRLANARVRVDSARPVRQVGFLEDFGAGCGPVCDCGQCVEHPGCGMEPIGGSEPACGIEVAEPFGPPPVTLGERSCGVEPGCGLEDCSTCYPPQEPHCGSDLLLSREIGCGVEPAGDCMCGDCRSTRELDCYPLFLPILRVQWCRFQFFSGSQGFTGPMNYTDVSGDDPPQRSGAGSFGYYQGFNEGRSLRRLFGVDIASQFGLRATQANLSGAPFTSDSRYQVFLTGGFFRRVDYGLQYGVVVDYLNEDWYFQGDLTQLRGELSWRTRSCQEFGFRFASGLGDDQSTTAVNDAAGNSINTTVAFEPLDQYRFFFRQPLERGGSWTGLVGWSDDDHGIFGGRISLPLTRCFGLQTDATYLIPSDESIAPEHESEAWNIAVGFSYSPGGPRGGGRYSRPLFGVADNGTFVVRRK